MSRGAMPITIVVKLTKPFEEHSPAAQKHIVEGHDVLQFPDGSRAWRNAADRWVASASGRNDAGKFVRRHANGAQQQRRKI
jgi:hypothetical protein